MKYVIVIALGLIFLGCAGQDPAQSNVPVDAFEAKIANSGIQLLDVRTPGEYQSGHLKNAFLANWNNQAEFKERVAALDKSKPVYTYCLSGARSGAATQWLRANGYEAYNMEGGIAAWKRANKPVEGMRSVKQISLDEYRAGIPADKTVLVDFGAEWCPPCKKMAPTVDSLVSDKKLSFTLLRIDGGDQTDLCRQLFIEAFPVFIVYKQGKETWRKQGILSSEDLAKQLR